MKNKMMALPRSVKRLVVVVVDIVLALVATWLAFTLRLDTLHRPAEAQWIVYVLAPLLSVPLFIRFGLYRTIFRYTGQAALHATTKAVMLYTLVFTFVLLVGRWPGVPRSLGVLQPLIFLFFCGR